jgi:RNA polymerase sigma-70 factor (ECF subfamily)
MAHVVTDVVGASAARAADADEIRWEELVATVHRQMRSIAGPTRDLEDLTQNALEQVLRSLDRFEGRGELSTFTYRVCVHVAMNHWRWWRRWLRRFELGGSDDEREPAAPCTSELAIERERARRLHAALEKIAPAKRVVLTLVDLEELPAARVAEIVGCPEPTVRSRLRQARIELTQRLARDPAFREGSDAEDGR